MSFKIDNSDFLKRMKKYRRYAKESADKGLFKAGQFLLKKSLDVVPVGDTRDLRNSGQSEKTGDLQYTVSYGGRASQYAIRLHEHPEYDFRTDKNPKAQGKYLEQPFKQNEERLERIIANEIKV